MQIMNRFCFRAALIALVLGLGVPLMAASALESMNHNGISYISGGVGDEEQSAIKNLSADYNLEVLMALKNGNYLADVNVRITDTQGNVLLETVSNGPFLLVDLQPGVYVIAADYQGKQQQKTAYLDRGEHEQLNFYW